MDAVCGLAGARRAATYLLLAGSLIVGAAPAAFAQDAARGGLAVEISRESAALAAAEWVQFGTLVTNESTIATPPLAAHLSIAGLDQGKHVDPEDWSPERTQFLPSLRPGESAELNWLLHALFEGAFVSFVTVVPMDESFAAATSKPLRLEVTPDNILPLTDVIFVVATVPLLPLALLVFVAARARRRGAA